jgi:hypothetical protein
MSDPSQALIAAAPFRSRTPRQSPPVTSIRLKVAVSLNEVVR